MADYWFTFRIDYDSTYDDRYKALIEAAHSYDQGRWAMPTSFYLLEANDDIDAVARKLIKPLNRSKDTLLICYTGNEEARFLGPQKDFEFVKSFLSGAKKL